MRYLGIDFGTKHIGLALSDESGKIAFPHNTIDAKSDVVFALGQLIEKEHVEAIVIGEPAKETALYDVVHTFAKTLTESIEVPICFQNEAFTSLEAQRFIDYKKPTARLEKQSTTKKNDASAAALILQRYLDRISRV